MPDRPAGRQHAVLLNDEEQYIGHPAATAVRQAPAKQGQLAPHLVRLSGDWALWRTVALRGAGFPVSLLAGLGAPALASAADSLNAETATAETANPGTAGAAYATEFTAEVRRQSSVLYQVAGLPPLREAIAWQNRHALTTGIDVLIRRGPEPAKRNTKSRQHEALIASYLQRYCAKNDTIGFFGPLGWSGIDDEAGVRVAPAAPGKMIAARVTYLEGWAVRAILARHQAALRPWLVPRQMPLISADGTQWRLPLGKPRPLTAAEAAVLRASDGIRDATEVAAAVLADPASGMDHAEQVFALLGRLADRQRVAWQIDVAAQER